MAEIYKVDKAARKFLFEGVQGENEARSIQFDITPWTTELGNGAVTATAKRPTDAAPYPVTVTRNGNTVTWKPTSTDTAIDGAGMFQLEYTVNSVLAKTCIWSTMVAPSLDPAGDPPDPYNNWLADMRSIEASAIQAADDAEASAASIAGDHNELLNIRIGADGTTYANAGDAVRGQVTTLKSGLDQYADLELTAYTPIRGTVKTGFIATDGTENTTNTGYVHFDFGIPKGTKRIYFQPWKTYGTGSAYSALAYYDKDGNFISSITNADLNPTTSTVTVSTYEGDVPSDATKATITFIASQNQLGNVVFYGYYDIKKHHRTLNSILSGDSSTEYALYLQVAALLPYSQLNDSKLSLTAKIKCPKTPLKYDVMVVGYDSSYGSRVVCGYFANMTMGINGNTIDINYNAYNKNNTLANKHYVGFLLNIKYAHDNSRPDYVKSFYEFTNEMVHDVEYIYINDIDVSESVFHIGGNADRSNLNIATNESHNPLYGGRLCTIGDSLTAVYYKQEEESWPYLIAKWNNMRLDNLGISGNPMAKTSAYTEDECMAERVDDLDPYKYYTHIFVMGGANDYNFSIPIGTNSDTEITTFKGAINHIIDTLIQKYPFAHIVFATTYQRNANKLDQPYADAMLELCESRCIPCLDNYRKSGVLFFNERWMNYHGATHALGNNHLSAAGDAFVAPRFEQALKYGVQ